MSPTLEHKTSDAGSLEKRGSDVDLPQVKTAISDDFEQKVSLSSYLNILACALWNCSISCFQILCLFWSAAIVADLGGAPAKLWLGQGFQVVTACIGPVLARLGDTVGRRYLILLGLAFGCLGAIVIATAKSFNVVILGSVLYGLSYGSAGNVLCVPSEVLPRSKRGTAQVLVFCGAPIGVLLGLYVFASFIQNKTGGTGWRTASWFNFALHGLTFCLFAAFYFPVPPPNPENRSVMSRIMHIDFAGLTLLGCSVVPLMMGLIWGGVVYRWNSAPVIACLVVGFGFAIALAAHQKWVNTDGLFGRKLITSRNFIVCLVSITVEGLVYNVFTSFYGEETAVLWNGTPFGLATRFAAFIWAAQVAVIPYGFYVHRYKDAKPVLIFGYSCFTIACELSLLTLLYPESKVIGLACAKPSTGLTAITWAIFGGIGFAAPLVFLNMITQLSVAPENMGQATSLIIASRSVGGALGIAIVGAVFDSKIAAKLPSYVAAALAAAGLEASSIPIAVEGIASSNSTLAATAPGITEAMINAGLQASAHAYADSFRYVWITVLPITVAALGGLFLLKSTKEAMNSIVDRPVHSLGGH